SKITDGTTSISGIADYFATISLMQVTGGTAIGISLENGASSAKADARGAFTISLANPLVGGERLRIYQSNSAGVSCIDALVIAPGDLGRIRFTFTGGEVVARDTGFESDSTLFLAFNVDKNWRWGGRLVLNPADNSYQWSGGVGNRILWNTF